MDALLDLGRGAHAVVTLADARSLGITEAAMRWAARPDGPLRREAPGVFVVRGAEDRCTDLAVALAPGRAGRAASHGAAGALRDVDGLGRWPADPIPVEITDLLGAGRRRWRVHQRLLVPEEVELCEGLPTTALLRTLLDLAEVLSDLAWERALEHALRNGVRYEDIVAALPGLGAARRPGVARMLRVLALRPADLPATDSELETAFWQEWRVRSGRPMPERQVEVWHRGRLRGRVDFLFRPERAFLEADGNQHETPEHRRADRMRRMDITSITGWAPGEVTWEDVIKRPSHTVRRVGAWLDVVGRRGEGFRRTQAS